MYFYGKGRIGENAHGGQSVSRNPGLVGGGSYQYLSDVVSGFQTALQSCPVPVDCDNRGLPVSYQ